jgi:dTDP-D-glucose 4,6-dehydratase
MMKVLKICGDGEKIHQYLYVDDVINAIEIILNKGKTKMIYNIRTLNEFSVLDIVKCLLTKLQPNKKSNDILTYVKPRSFREKTILYDNK